MSTELDEGSTGVAPEAPPYAGRGWSLAVIGLTAAVLAIDGSVGTKLGWPGIYWQHGGLVFWAYVAACLLFGIGSFLAVRGFSIQPPVPPSVTITLLVAVVLILKWLPPAESGIQVLPCAPWSYPGWLPFVIALAAWTFLIFILIADSPEETEIFLMYMLMLTLPLSFWTLGSSEPTSMPEQAAVDPLVEYRSQIAELRKNRDDAQRVLEILRRDQQALVERLMCLGVRTSADLKNVPAARPLAEELAEIVAQIQEQDREIQRLGMTLIKAESHLRRIERQKVIEATGSGKVEQEQLVRTEVELAEKVRSDESDFVALEVDEVVNDLLSKSEAKQQESHR